MTVAAPAEAAPEIVKTEAKTEPNAAEASEEREPSEPVPTVALTRVQMDTLRHQIAAFSHICRQNILLTQQQAEERRPGGGGAQYRALPGNPTLAAIASSIGAGSAGGSQPAYPGPIYSKDKSVPGQPRWSPTPAQLTRLEELFATGMGTPNGAIRTRITEELAKLGPINEANVYNWFQNKKARMKKKLQEEMAARAATRG